jgi:protocatechuate 3,4-dioxygenase alpha subunit
MSEPRGLTASQTVGPFFHLVLPWPDGADVVAEGVPGAVWIRGRVLDGAGDPVPDAIVETWQPDAGGRFAGDETDAAPLEPPSFRGFGRSPTDTEGRWAVRTVKPGQVTSTDGVLQAPHISVSVFARGLLDRVVTRIYFPEDGTQHATDPLLAALDAEARSTLVAEAEPDGYRFDVRLQGDHETVFLAI